MQNNLDSKYYIINDNKEISSKQIADYINWLEKIIIQNNSEYMKKIYELFVVYDELKQELCDVKNNYENTLDKSKIYEDIQKLYHKITNNKTKKNELQEEIQNIFKKTILIETSKNMLEQLYMLQTKKLSDDCIKELKLITSKKICLEQQIYLVVNYSQNLNYDFIQTDIDKLLNKYGEWKKLYGM